MVSGYKLHDLWDRYPPHPVRIHHPGPTQPHTGVYNVLNNLNLMKTNGIMGGGVYIFHFARKSTNYWLAEGKKL